MFYLSIHTSNQLLEVALPEDWLLGQLQAFVRYRWINRGLNSPDRTRMIEAATKDAFKRLVAPQMIRFGNF